MRLREHTVHVGICRERVPRPTTVTVAVRGGLMAGVALMWCAAGVLAAQGAVINGHVTDEPTPDSVFVANWVAAQGANTWRLDVGPNGRYRLWRVERGGDTLVASMGDWSLRPLPVSGPGSELVDHVCLAPFGRPRMCSRILLDDLGHPHGFRWQFIDRERAALSGQPVPDPVTVELIVEPDSTASQIRVVDAPTAAVRQLVERAIRTCSFVPGRLQGMPVRVRVRLPVPVGGSS